MTKETKVKRRLNWYMFTNLPNKEIREKVEAIYPQKHISGDLKDDVLEVLNAKMIQEKIEFVFTKPNIRKIHPSIVKYLNLK